MVQAALVASFLCIQEIAAASGISVLHGSRFVSFRASEEDRARRYIKEYKDKVAALSVSEHFADFYTGYIPLDA